MRTPTRRRSLVAAFLVALMLGLIASAPAAATGVPVIPAQDTSTTEAPTTEAPTTEAPTTEAPTTEAPDDGGDTGDAGGDDDSDVVTWIAIGVAILAAVILLGLIGSMISGGARRHRRTKNVEKRRLQHVLGGAAWVHDQVSIELMGGGGQSPERLRMSWSDSRRRITDLERECATVALDSDAHTAEDLNNLRQALGSLTGALDTSVDLRAREATDDATADALDASNQAVHARRNDLAVAIAAVRNRM